MAIVLMTLAFGATAEASAAFSSWTVHQVGQQQLSQGSCPTTTLCVVPDRAGELLVATDPLGSWATTDVDGSTPIYGSSCPTTSLCAAVDASGNVLTSTTPTVGASWNLTHVDSVAPGAGEGLWGISCPSTGLCVAVDNFNHVFTSSNPTGGAAAWSAPVTIDSAVPGLFRIECPSTTLCVAVDESGNVVTSTNPTGGASAWTQTKIDGTTPIYSIDCAGTALCVAGDSDGKLLWSTDPTGGASSWHTEPGDGFRVFGVACPSTSLCVAADNAGGIQSSTDPTSAGTWSVVATTGVTDGAIGLMCPSANECVAPSVNPSFGATTSGYYGEMAVSTSPAPTVTTGAADGLTAFAATVHGTVNPQGMTISDCHFEYGTSTSYGSTAPCAETVGGGTGDVAVHADLAELEPSQTYHFRLIATGAGTGTGDDGSFVTDASAPQAITENADGIGLHAATLHGIVYPYNQTVTDCHFDYGTTATPYSNSVPCVETVGSGFGPVIVHADITGLANNATYHFRVVATNGTGPGDGLDVTFTTDAVDTTITDGPSGPTNDATPTFAFTADPSAGATFMCWFDAGAPQPCSSPSTPAASLADGAHTFQVQATSGGHADPTPARRDFFVDTVAPVTTLQIVGGVRVGQSSSYHGAVLLTASANDPAPSSSGVQTRCEFTGAGSPPPASFDALSAGCTPPIVSAPGDYVFYGASRDAAGNEEAVRSVTFTILPAVEVNITSAPSGDTWEKQPSFGFTSITTGATFRCHIDQAPYVTCSSLWLSPAQDPGAHAFYVKAVAPDGTESQVQAAYYTIQAPRPDVHGHCAVDPFVVDPNDPNASRIVGCGFGTCPPRIACSPAIDACPFGAICTLRFTSHFTDADPALTFELVSLCQKSQDCTPYEMDDSWYVFQRFGAVATNDCDANVLDDPTGCDVTTTYTSIGTNRAISPICFGQLDGPIYEPVRPGVTMPRDFGPDSTRHLDCDATESIAPASALDMASVTPRLYESYLYVPAAGQLALTGAQIAAFAASKQFARPSIAAIKIIVKGPGAVHVRFRLNRAAKQILVRRHKLTLRIVATLTLAGQRITRTHAVTFTAPAHPPSARQRRRQARRLCIRAHPHQAKLCDRL